MHWCMDETLALLSLIPFIGFLFNKLHVWWHSKFHHKCHEEGCESEHVEHTYSPYDKANWHKDVTVSEEDMEYLRGTPAPLKITIPVTIEEASQEGFSLTTRGLIVGAILVHGPMTHEQVAKLHPEVNADELYSTINELVEEGGLVLDGDLLKEGDIFK